MNFALCFLNEDLSNEGVLNDILFEDDNDNELVTRDNNQLLLENIPLIITTTRPNYYVRNRIVWSAHVSELTSEGPIAFNWLYRMSIESFTKLCHYLDPFLQVDFIMSTRRTNKDVISTPIILSCYIRYISGGSYLDIRHGAGISIASFYACVHKFIQAILDCPQLAYCFPKYQAEWNNASETFQSISSNNAIVGCVACIDGYLLRVKVPSSNEVGNVKSFLSGHYQAYGVNFQAACDYKCPFLEVAVITPGGANDIRTCQSSTLAPLVENLPVGMFAIGDNAYGCSEHLLTPFSGPQKTQPDKDAYNFYISQLRIRIEMAFGVMVTKWRILKLPI
jgi:hypothetical protein